MRARSLLLSLVCALLVAHGSDPRTPTASALRVMPTARGGPIGRRPSRVSVGFEPAGDASFRAHAGGYEIRLDAAGATLVPTGAGARATKSTLRMVPIVVGRLRVPEGEAVLPGLTNYLLGRDPASWKVAVSRFGAVRFADAFPGIDWLFRVDDGGVAYDFVVSPGADPSSIRLGIEGAGAIELDADGSLRVRDGAAEFSHSAPEIYQLGASGRERIAGGFVIEPSGDAIGLWVGPYDVGRELVIDPAIGFSTYFGGMSSEDLPRIALGPDGSVFLVGTTASSDLPSAAAKGGAAAGATLAGDLDAFVVKLLPDGAGVAFVTYLGGSGTDRGAGVAVADDGSVWISGETASLDFPGVDDGLAGPTDAFVARISADGTTVEFAALVGGSGAETGTGLARDAGGHIYLTGSTGSPDFRTVASAQDGLGGGSDAFVVKLHPAGDVVYATYLGGAKGNDAGFAIAADEAGNAYVTGSTEAADFPTVIPVQPGFGGPGVGGSGDAFVAKLGPSGEIVYATTLGGSDADVGLGIAVDGDGAAYVTGQTASPDFPTRNPFQRLPGGGADAFVTKIAADGRSVVYSTFLGGEAVDVGAGIAVDGAGNAHVTGMTASADFPSVDSLQPFFGGGADVFVTRINDLGSALTYSTYSGGGGADAGIGIAVDGGGNAYVVGQTSSGDFPTFNPVQPDLRGSQDTFVTKYCLSLVFPQERELASGVARDSFAVTTPAGCAWIAFSQAPWITLTSPNVVAGAAEVQFEVAANATGLPRSGTLNIAGADVTVAQAAATDCDYEVSPSSENFYMVGGVGRINVRTRDDCAWAASTNETWISISGGDRGTGPGVVSYTVETNRTGRQRSGAIIVAGQTFIVFDWLREPLY